MSDEFKMMYTAQADIVLDTLARDGVYYVKKIDQRKYLNKFDSIQNLLGLTDKEHILLPGIQLLL